MTTEVNETPNLVESLYTLLDDMRTDAAMTCRYLVRLEYAIERELDGRQMSQRLRDALQDMRRGVMTDDLEDHVDRMALTLLDRD
jgi:hypothetical protein